MQTVFNLLSIGFIGGADGPTAVSVAGDLPLPAIFVAVLGFIFVLYVYITKAIRKKALSAGPAAAVETPTAKNATAPIPSGMNQGELELIDTDETTAAVIMAIVSDKSGIPLNRLSFKSIKLLEDQ